MSRTHLKQSVEESVDFPISTSESSEPVKPKSNSKPIWVWRKKVASPLEVPPQEFSSSEPTEVLNNKLHEEKSRSKDIKTPNPHRKVTR